MSAPQTLTNEEESSSDESSVSAVVWSSDDLTQLIQSAVTQVSPHQLPHRVPGVAGHAGQVDHLAEAGDVGDQSLGRDEAVHDDTLEYLQTLQDLLINISQLGCVSIQYYPPIRRQYVT